VWRCCCSEGQADGQAKNGVVGRVNGAGNSAPPSIDRYDLIMRLVIEATVVQHQARRQRGLAYRQKYVGL
jgi:hypothetical protein